jgi:hypothetical protein
MTRRTLPKKAGEPCIKSGKPMTANLDVGSVDRITWMKHLTQRVLKAEAGASVLIRRAIEFYAAYMERILIRHEPEELEDEAFALKLAARGEQAALPEEDLIAVPPKLFSAIQHEAREAARVAGIARIHAGLAEDIERMDLRRGLSGDEDDEQSGY